VLAHRQVFWLPVAAGLFFLTYAARIALDGLGSTLNFGASQRMVFRTRLRLLRHWQRLNAEYHESRPAGDMLHRLEQDVEQVATLSSEVVTGILRIVMITSLVLLTMCILNFRLAAIVVPFIPIFLLARRIYQQRLRQCSDSVLEHSSRMSMFLHDHLSAIVQLQLLSREMAEARRFARLSAASARAQIERKRTELLFASFLYLIIIAGIATVLGYGGYQVMGGSMSTGSLVAFYAYTLQLFIPLYGLADLYSKLQRVGASINRLMEITQARAVIVDRPNAIALPGNTPGEIELRNISFSYRLGRALISGLTLRVYPGERVAIVGESGSGKSTIAKLIARLYDVQQGAILVDGEDLRNLKLRNLRSIIAFVPQEPLLFDATLRENLLVGNPGAAEAELERAAAIARLQSVLERLPRGWDEPLGPRGCRLSGGERQRVTIARAVLQQPRILVLDECTSALDALTEESVLDALGQHTHGIITVIVISHRPYAIEWADRLVVLDNGGIAKRRHDYHRSCDSSASQKGLFTC
jgi:ABC-type multidrug transport system fused ATPase/permease subunit